MNNRKTHEEYIAEVKNVNDNIEVVEQYINVVTPIVHKCKICGNEWPLKPNHALQGHGCPECAKSHGEQKIKEWVQCHNIKYIPQYKFDNCRDKYPLPFDFYLPDYNSCIEFDGEQHFKPIDFFGGEEGFRVRQLHDQIKTDYCNANNIHLLRISYDKI